MHAYEEQNSVFFFIMVLSHKGVCFVVSKLSRVLPQSPDEKEKDQIQAHRQKPHAYFSHWFSLRVSSMVQAPSVTCTASFQELVDLQA